MRILEVVREKQYFEILLEEMRSNFRLAFEGFEIVNNRLDRLESGQANLESDVGVLKSDVGVLKSDVGELKSDVRELKSDVRDVKRNMGLINSIASDHETRLQNVENSLRDHLSNHS